MGKASKAAAPVLEGDKTLRFPHALLISASAGSGKTYTLTQRYVQFLLSDKVPGNDLPNILAVTFTNNAAKEMKARILAWLKELALDKDCQKMDETLAPLCVTELALKKRATKTRLAALLSLNPARILGLRKKGRLVPGFDADITVLDPVRMARVPEKFFSLSSNSPFAGRELRGWPAATVLGGEIVFLRR